MNTSPLRYRMQTILYFLLTLYIGTTLPSLSADPAPPQNTTIEAPQADKTIPHATPAPDEPYFSLPIEEPSKQNDKFLVEFLNMLATLGFVIALILVIAWFLKRFVNTRLESMNANSAIRVVEKRGLSPKTILYLLEVEGKTILVAESQNGLTALTEYNTPSKAEPTASKEFPSPFSKLLEK